VMVCGRGPPGILSRFFMAGLLQGPRLAAPLFAMTKPLSDGTCAAFARSSIFVLMFLAQYLICPALSRKSSSLTEGSDIKYPASPATTGAAERHQ
jgi:hypothetical protein